jgi:hypothetical protein
MRRGEELCLISGYTTAGELSLPPPHVVHWLDVYLVCRSGMSIRIGIVCWN